MSLAGPVCHELNLRGCNTSRGEALETGQNFTDSTTIHKFASQGSALQSPDPGAREAAGRVVEARPCAAPDAAGVRVRVNVLRAVRPAVRKLRRKTCPENTGRIGFIQTILLLLALEPGACLGRRSVRARTRYAPPQALAIMYLHYKCRHTPHCYSRTDPDREATRNAPRVGSACR